MKKIFILIIALISLSACSTLHKQKQKPESPHRKDVTISEINIENSLMFFSLANEAIYENNYSKAYDFLIKAYHYNPQSKEILEKLAPLILDIGDYQKDDTAYQQLIEIGENARKDKIDSDVLYYAVAFAYLHKKNTPKGNEFMDLMKKSTSNSAFLLSYYHFKLQFFKKDMTKVLKQAFASYNGEEDFEKEVLIISELKPNKVLKYAKRLYKTKNDKKSLHLLITLYRKLQKEDDAIELLKAKIEENADIATEDLRFFVTYLYLIKNDKDAIVKYFPNCNDDISVSTFIILAQYGKKKYDLALNCFERFDNGKELSDIFGEEMYDYLKFTLYLYTQNYDKTYQTLNNLKTSLKKFELLGVAANTYKDTTLAFINYIKEHYPKNNEICHFYLSSYYKALDNTAEMKNNLDRLSDDFIKSEKGLPHLVGMLYLTADANIDKIKHILSYSANDSVSVNYILALNYRVLHKDSLAVKYILDDLNTNKKPTILELYSISQLFETKKGYKDMLLNLYEDAIDRYPSSPSVLNLFGYYVADYSIKEKYPKAEKALLKALQMKPDDINYIDSIAWLYYRMQEYQKALEWINKIPLKDIKFSEVAYHLGIIQLKNNEIKKSKDAFKYAIQLNNSDKITNLAKQKLLELGEKSE